MRISTYEIILPLIGKDDKEIAGQALLVNGLYDAIDGRTQWRCGFGAANA